MPHSEFKNLHIVDHPIVQDRLSRLRRKETNTEDFRRWLREIAVLMTYEATKDLALEARPITTPVTESLAPFLRDEEPVIIPILRAGLGFSDGVKDVLTSASFGHVGVYRDEETKRPVEYLVKLPSEILSRDVIVVDPMLATGYSMEYALDVLIKRGVSKNQIKIMVLVATPEGLRVLQEKYANIPIFTASVDEGLNEDCFIVPGLGDAGDRIFGTL
jgi:uracil phosphoribosyltransferase